ncbi:hypothetical protein ADUPG1_011610, partial [Aduncisulcus paluster]
RDVAGAMWTLRETRKLTLKDGDLDTFDMELRNTFSKHCSSLQIRPAASPALKSSNDMSVTEIYSHGLSRIPTMCTSLLCECLEGSDVADRGEGTFGHGSMLGRMASFSHSYLSLPLFPTLCSFATPSCVSLFFSSLLSLMLSTSIHLSVPRCVAESVRSLCMVADVLKNVCVRCRDDGVIEESDDYEYYYEEEEDEEEEELEPIDTQEAKDLGMDEKESGIDDATALIDEDTGTEADSDVTVDGLQSLSVSQSKGSEGEVEDDIEWFGGLTTAAVSTSFSNTVDDISPLPSFPPSLFSQTKFFVFLSTHTTMDFQRSHSLLSLFLSLFSYSRVLGHCIWEMILCTIQDVMVFMTLHKNHPFHYICSCSSLFADSFSTSSTDSPFSLLLSSIFFSLIPSLPLHSFRCATLACVSDLNHPHRLSSLFHSQIHTELCKEDQDGSVMLVKSWQKEKGESLIGQEGEERLSKVRRNIIKDVSEAKLKPLSLLFPFVLPFSSLGRPISLSYLPITLMSRVDLLAWVWGDISEKWVKLSTEEGLTWSGSVTVCEFIKYILKEHAGYTHEMSTVNGHESWNGMEEEGKEEWDECRDLLHWCGGRWERVSLIDDVTFECVFPYISTQDLCSVFSVASQEPISTVTLFNPISSLLLSPSLSSILPHLSSLLELCCESVGGAYSPLLHTLGTILTDHSNHFESLAVFTTLIEEYIHHIPFFVFPLCLDVCSSVIRSGGDGGIVGVQLIGQIIDHVTRGRSLPEAHLIRKEVASGETKEDGGEDSDVSPLSSFFQSLLFSGISLLCSSLTHPERDVCVECANRVSECAIDCILVVSEELASGIISVLCDSCIKVSKDCEKEKRSDKNRRKPRDYKVRRRELCSSAKDRVFDIHLHASNLPPASSLMGSYALKDKEVSVGCVCLCLVRRCMSAVLWKQGMRTSHPMEIPCVTPSAVSSMYLSSLACLTHAISSLTSACFSLAVCALCEIWCLMHNEMLVSIALEEEKKCKSDASVSPDESKNGLTEKESKMVRSLSYSVPQLPVNLASALFSYHSVWISISHGISISLLSSTPFFTLLSRCGLSYCDVIPLSPFSTIASVVSISVLMDRVSEGVKKKENEFYLTLLAPLSAVTPTCTHTLSLCFYIAVGLCGNERMRFKLEKLVTRVRTEAEYDEDEKRERRDVDDSELSYDFISPQDTTFLKKFYNDMVHSVEPDDIGKIPSCLPFLEHQPSVQVFSKYIQMCIAQVEFLDEASFLRSVPLLLPVLSLVIRECIRDGFVEEGALGVFVCEKLCNWCSNIEEKGGEAEMMSIWKEMEKLLFYCVNSVTHSRFVDISPPMVSVLNHIMQYIYGHTHDSELIKDVPTSLIGPLSLLLSYFALLPSCPLSPLSPPHSVEVWGTLNKCWKTNITILQDIITFGWERETLLHDEVLGATIAAEAESGEERDGEKKRNEVSLVLLQKWGKKPLPGSFSPLILVQFFLSLFFRLSLLLSSASGISEHTLEMHKDVAQLLMKIRVPQRFCSIFGMEKNSVEDGKAHIACMLPAVKVLMPVSDERVRHSCERLFDVVSRTLMLIAYNIFVSSRYSCFVNPERIHKGGCACCPISLDSPNVLSPDFLAIKARDSTKKKSHHGYNQSHHAQTMMKGYGFDGFLTHISIPFSSPSSIKGVYIHLNGNSWSSSESLSSHLIFTSTALPSHLVFTFSSSNGQKVSKKYEFPDFEGHHWYFLPVDLLDIILCEITGKGKETMNFNIQTLLFIREETHEETIARETKEKVWSEAVVMKPEFVHIGSNAFVPIPRDDPKLINPSFLLVQGKDDSERKESKKYDQSSRAQRMLKGEVDDVHLSYLSIPFLLPHPVKGAYICVHKYGSSPSLLFTFSDSDGKKTYKKYEFTEPHNLYAWHFLPIDLSNIVLCEIEGKGTWDEKNCRWFGICSLVFTMPDESEIIERLSLLPWEHYKDTIEIKMQL